MQIIQKARRGEGNEYRLAFDYVGHTGWGFSFDCDADGRVNADAFNPDARRNYDACLSGVADGRPVVARGVKHYQWTYRVPAVGRCDCGAEVTLDGFTNTCECGRDYNMSGQLLAPRCQWGEETGETAADILTGRF